MIKINLLNPVTERQGGAVVAVDRKVSSPSSRFLLMFLVVGVLLVAVVGWDILSTTMAKAKAEKDLEEQKQIAAELAVVMKEQKELEDKINQIDGRINAIKKLRDEQKGPSAVLEALRERLAMVPGIYLQSVELKAEQMEIKGNSPDEAAVTQFGRSLEFSSGLFTNLNIETQRQSMPSAVPVAQGKTAPQVNLVNFTIKMGYSPSNAGGSSGPAPTQASVPQAGQPSTPVQVAKN